MAKETRQVTQYKLMTLVKINLIPRKDLSPTREEAPIAVFDDRELCDAYATAMGGESYVREEWRELLPTADQFSLPFNPEFNAEAAQ